VREHDCPCPYPELPHPITESNRFHAEQRALARARNGSGQFISSSEEAWQALPEAQRKLLGYRKPRKPKSRTK
jgi:hypothetical protein